MTLDGQLKHSEALELFVEIEKKSSKGTFYEAEAAFEVARLNLLLALSGHPDRADRLQSAYDKFEIWIERKWPTVVTKAWAYYHQACILSQWINDPKNNLQKDEMQRQFAAYRKKYLAETVSFEGLQRRHWISARSSTLDTAERYLPGDPVRCGLEKSFLASQ